MKRWRTSKSTIQGDHFEKDRKKQYFLSRDPPPIAPPEHKKEDVYENNMNVFETVDETAKEVRENSWLFFFTKTPLQAAKTEYHTFSSLVRVLVKYCTSELDKARAIFRLKKELTNVSFLSVMTLSVI